MESATANQASIAKPDTHTDTNMNIDSDDFRIYADRIWTRGESQHAAQSCFIPSYYCGKDDDVIDKYDVTHFDLAWKERGKSVLVNLYRGEGFGACLDLELVGSTVVTV